MSRLEVLDLRALRARLIVALEAELDGSLYLLAIAACFLACDPASVGEIGMWESIFHTQAEAEAVEADRLLDVLGSITEMVS
jgi:hypothetical protein